MTAYVVMCEVCRAAGPPQASAWALIDPSRQWIAGEMVPKNGVQLVVTPPVVRAGVGRIAVHLEGRILGDVDLMICPVERRAVLEHVRVDEDVRRRGYGRVLLAAARARGVGYEWSQTKINDSLEARAFWARVLIQSHYADHDRLLLVWGVATGVGHRRADPHAHRSARNRGRRRRPRPAADHQRHTSSHGQADNHPGCLAAGLPPRGGRDQRKRGYLRHLVRSVKSGSLPR
jgi:GNAT superfamily N-acetyltransferase